MMKVDDLRVQKFYEHLARINQTAYQDEFLLTTEALSKSPFCRSILPILMTGRPAPQTTRFTILKKIFHYYINNFLWYLIQLGKHAAHFVSRQKYHIGPNTKTLTLIDILFYTPNIITEQDYKCIHFPGLEEVLTKQGKDCAYTTKFFDTSNPLRLFKVFKILKKNKRPVLTEFQLLNFNDYLLAFRFLLTYPFHAMKLIKNFKSEPEDGFLTHAIIDSLSGPSLLYYFQLLYGRRISQLPVKSIKCISWYENQPREKCFYKGLRSVKGKVDLYGAQLYVWPSNLGSINPDESEINFGIVPDKIVVNGPFYLPQKSHIKYRVGPSLRSGRLFKTQANPAESENILILMPYFEPQIEYFLKLINQMDLTQSLLLKFHPGVDRQKFEKRIKQGVQIVEGDLFDFLVKSKMVIGMATSTLAEAACLGIPAVSIENNEEGLTEFSHSFLPKLGKGIIWDNASNVFEVSDRINKFTTLMEQKPEKIAEMGRKYKEIFFCPPSHQKIIEAFDLN
jgi:hypothetical protein